MPSLDTGSTNVQLQSALADVPHFAGVFAADQLPRSAQRPFSLIANYSRAGSAGTHWVGMSFPLSGPAQYFDSYGLAPDRADPIIRTHTAFEAYLRMHSANGGYRYNVRDLQCLGTGVCGDYAAFFIRHGLPQDSRRAWWPITHPESCMQRDDTVRDKADVV